jgi:hypothetical protein
MPAGMTTTTAAAAAAAALAAQQQGPGQIAAALQAQGRSYEDLSLMYADMVRAAVAGWDIAGRGG